jgi:hypothetical protein
MERRALRNSKDLCANDVQFNIKATIVNIVLCQEKTRLRFSDRDSFKISRAIHAIDATTRTAIGWFHDQGVVFHGNLLE